MANIAPPSKKANSAEKKEKVVELNATEKPSPVAIKPIQLKVPEGKKNEFKAYAATKGRSMNDLFLEMFEEYKKNHG